MKEINGIQVGSQIFKYGSKVFQTDGGFLLKFINDADKWLGVFPGCSWDRFYDEVMISLSYPCINKLVFKQRLARPTIIDGSNNAGSCYKCGSSTDYKFCSVSCWFFHTIELERQIIADADNIAKIERQVYFVEQMVNLFGQQVDEEQLNPTQL